jgi:hypothetical protein
MVMGAVVDVPLAPSRGAFPLTLPIGQGRTLYAIVPVTGESTPARGRLSLEVFTSDGLMFSTEAVVPELPVGGSWSISLKA